MNNNTEYQYFELLAKDLDVSRFLSEIEALEDPWGLQKGRQEKIAVQREAQTIPIRGLVKSSLCGRKRRDAHRSRYTKLSRKFPRLRAFLEAFASEQRAELSRAKLVRLLPGHRVYPHVDRGDYYRVRDRYHLVLRSTASYMKAGEEEISMVSGELWWFDNKALHEACNDGAGERIHVIFDLLPWQQRDYVEATEHAARVALQAVA